MNVGGFYVFGANTQTDYARWNSLQNWPTLHQLNDGSDFDRSIGAQDSFNDPVLRQDLEPLRYAGWKGAPFLHLLKEWRERLAGRERSSENVCCSYRVLYSQVDSYAANR